MSSDTPNSRDPFRRFSHFVLRLGRHRSLVVLTVVTVLASVTLSELVITVLGRGDRRIAAASASLASLVLTPLLGSLMLRLVFDLEAARRQLAELAIRDELTGISNRRHFMATIQREWDLARRHASIGTLLLIDADGRPRSPGLMYNDARSVAEAARIAKIAPAESGAHGRSSALAKLLHLLAQDAAADARHAVHQADWIAGRLCAQHGISDENNALKLGYDPVTRSWPAWLDDLGVPRALLPKVLVPGTSFAAIDPAVARSLGLPSSAEIAAGTTDGVASFIATGADQPCLLYTSPSPRDRTRSRMPSSA